MAHHQQSKYSSTNLIHKGLISSNTAAWDSKSLKTMPLCRISRIQPCEAWGDLGIQLDTSENSPRGLAPAPWSSPFRFHSFHVSQCWQVFLWLLAAAPRSITVDHAHERHGTADADQRAMGNCQLARALTYSKVVASKATSRQELCPLRALSSISVDSAPSTSSLGL